MYASVGRLHNCFTKHEFIVWQKRRSVNAVGEVLVIYVIEWEEAITGFKL